nr:unnamed protein product [Callosobruchus chinensis]CAH7752010.1 unnamed protein product [Callosobruchus chinensis]CAH7756502.1 unnamed protein product [Callosobruchus chinensis]
MQSREGQFGSSVTRP